MRYDAKSGKITGRKWNLFHENAKSLFFSHNTAAMLTGSCNVEIDFNSIL